jgi:hypothetical protein
VALLPALNTSCSVFIHFLLSGHDSGFSIPGPWNVPFISALYSIHNARLPFVNIS